MTGSKLYARAMAYYEANEEDGGALQHKVWDPTPWMLDVYTGSGGTDRDCEIRIWCDEQLGDEASPIHGHPGRWQRGSATVFGWTWIGFDTEEAMRAFQLKWGGHEDEDEHDSKAPAPTSCEAA